MGAGREASDGAAECKPRFPAPYSAPHPPGTGMIDFLIASHVNFALHPFQLPLFQDCHLLRPCFAIFAPVHLCHASTS